MSYTVVVANDISSGTHNENIVSGGSDQANTYQQSFVGTGQPIRRIQLRVKRNVLTHPSGNAACSIRAANSIRRATGTTLATSANVSASAFNYGSFDWVNFDLPADFTPTAGTDYILYITFGMVTIDDLSTWDCVSFEKNQNGLNGVNHDGRSSRYREGYGLYGDLFDSTTSGTPPVSTLNIMFRLLSYPPPIKTAAFSASLSLLTNLYN